ncbi:MAG: heavy metal-associated domain-containing protein [Candidatus Eisenbacteria bacterium]
MTRKVWIIPAVIIVLTFAGILGARAVRIPTLTFRYAESVEGKVAHTTFTVQGIHCYGTAESLREHIGSLAGLVSITVYAGRRQVDIWYQPDKTSPEQIISAIEDPIMTEAGPVMFFEVVSSDDE